MGDLLVPVKGLEVVCPSSRGAKSERIGDIVQIGYEELYILARIKHQRSRADLSLGTRRCKQFRPKRVELQRLDGPAML